MRVYNLCISETIHKILNTLNCCCPTKIVSAKEVLGTGVGEVVVFDCKYFWIVFHPDLSIICKNKLSCTIKMLGF